ncbi:MAG: hypothetical protein ABI430_04170 [Candidatus Taylorbacteria bacterium]
MQNDKNTDRLDSIETNLYSRNPKPYTPIGSAPLKKEDIEVVSDWKHEKDMERPVYIANKASSVTKKIMLFSLIFFVIALSFGLYIYYHGSNVFSSDNIQIVVSGPTGTAGGEALILGIVVRNNNNITLEDANLKIEYPEGTRQSGDLTLELKREQLPLGNIPPGGEIKKDISAILFGEENSKKEINLSVEYRVKGSNAIYEKKKIFEIALISSPISIRASSLKEINSGQDIELTLDIVSNSDSLLKDLVFKANYPFGFSFKSAKPAPSFDSYLWRIGDLKPGEKRTIKIQGTMLGQNEEERIFRFDGGLQSQKDEKTVDPIFLTVEQSVLIKKPFIGIDLVLDGESLPIHVASLGRDIRGDVIWENNLSSQISDVEIKVKIGGSVNESSINPTSGFYNSTENTMLWNSGTDSDLQSINPGENGRVSFSFSSIVPQPENLGTFKNPEILLSVNVKGKRSEEQNVPEEIISSASAKVRIQASPSLSTKLLYHDGPFTNTGSIPPQADKETTYTVTWDVGSSFNDVRDAVVSTTLPPYVKWKNAVSPSTEHFSYNPAGGVVTWNIGEIKAGAGGERVASFQVSFLPSISQEGFAPVLVNQTTLSGVDRFTETEIRATKESLTSELTADSGYNYGDGKVVR